MAQVTQVQVAQNSEFSWMGKPDTGYFLLAEDLKKLNHLAAQLDLARSAGIDPAEVASEIASRIKSMAKLYTNVVMETLTTDQDQAPF